MCCPGQHPNQRPTTKLTVVSDINYKGYNLYIVK